MPNLAIKILESVSSYKSEQKNETSVPSADDQLDIIRKSILYGTWEKKQASCACSQSQAGKDL